MLDSVGGSAAQDIAGKCNGASECEQLGLPAQPPIDLTCLRHGRIVQMGHGHVGHTGQMICGEKLLSLSAREWVCLLRRTLSSSRISEPPRLFN
jgi:hypothetical protein